MIAGKNDFMDKLRVNVISMYVVTRARPGLAQILTDPVILYQVTRL